MKTRQKVLWSNTSFADFCMKVDYHLNDGWTIVPDTLKIDMIRMNDTHVEGHYIVIMEIERKV